VPPPTSKPGEHAIFLSQADAIPSSLTMSQTGNTARRAAHIAHIWVGEDVLDLFMSASQTCDANVHRDTVSLAQGQREPLDVRAE
jgi:hypothetical protein